MGHNGKNTNLLQIIIHYLSLKVESGNSHQNNRRQFASNLGQLAFIQSCIIQGIKETFMMKGFVHVSERDPWLLSPKPHPSVSVVAEENDNVCQYIGSGYIEFDFCRCHELLYCR